MNCQEARQWTSPYLDSELDPTKTFEVSRHLEACADCRKRFEMERRAEQLIAEKLRRHSRYIDWPALHDKVFAPWSSRQAIRKLVKPKWALAAAACIAFIIIGFGQWSESTLANPAGWAVDELLRLSPDCTALVGDAQCNTNVDAVCVDVLHRRVQLPIAGGRLQGHPTTVVHAMRRTCPTGNCRVEVRLNCCGNPVLLSIGRAEQMGELQQVVGLLAERGGLWSYECDKYDHHFHVAARRIGDHVVVGVSPHNVDHLVSAVNLVAGQADKLPPLGCSKQKTDAKSGR